MPKLASMLIGFRLASNQSLRELAPAKISSEQSERALEARNIKIERAKQSSSLLMLIKWDRPLNAAFICSAEMLKSAPSRWLPSARPWPDLSRHDDMMAALADYIS